MSYKDPRDLLNLGFPRDLEADENIPRLMDKRGHQPIVRDKPTQTLAFGLKDKPPSQVSSPPRNDQLRPLLKWSAMSGLPQNLGVQLYTNRGQFVGSSAIILVASVDWSVQATDFHADVDFVHGTKFNLFADNFTVTTRVVDGVFTDAINVQAIVTQAGDYGNQFSPQYTLRASGAGAASPVAIPVPKFAREFSVLRKAVTTAYTVSYRDNTNIGSFAQTVVPGSVDLIRAPIPNETSTLIFESAPDLTNLEVIFYLDL